MNAMGRAATAVVGAILVLGPTPATAVTNARAEKRPIVLELASRDSDLGGDPAVAEFAARVERLSGGRLHIDVVGGWGNLQRGAEQQIVRDVAGGRADLGAVGTRVFDTLGVRSF